MTHAAARRRRQTKPEYFDAELLFSIVEDICQVPRDEFCGATKTSTVVRAKESLILAARRLGASTTALSKVVGVSSASISRRHDAAINRSREDDAFSKLNRKIIKAYSQRAT